VAVLAEFGRKAEETRQLHASSPGAGEGNCRRFVVIDTSHSELKVSAVPRRALTFLSVLFRGMGIYGLTLIGRGHFSEVYSCKDLNGQPTGRVVKVSKTASSLDSIKGGQAGTEAYAMFLGEMCAQSGKRSPFVRVMLELILFKLAVPAQHDNQYVSVLFMEEGVRTVKEDVLRLAAGIHLLDSSFSAGRAAVRPCCRAAVRPCCRAAGRPCGRAVVRPGRPCCRAAVPHCCRAAGQPCGREAVHPTAEARHSLQQNEGLLWWWRWWRRRSGCERVRLPGCRRARRRRRQRGP